MRQNRHVQFERRTVASAQARHLRPDSDDGLGHYNPDRSEGPWGRAVKPLARRCCAEPPTSTQSEEYLGGRRHEGRMQTKCSWHKGRLRLISRPWSRTGENPPYGISGGTMETSASFEARSAPSSYPTASQFLVPREGGSRHSLSPGPPAFSDCNAPSSLLLRIRDRPDSSSFQRGPG